MRVCFEADASPLINSALERESAVVIDSGTRRLRFFLSSNTTSGSIRDCEYFRDSDCIGTELPTLTWSLVWSAARHDTTPHLDSLFTAPADARLLTCNGSKWSHTLGFKRTLS